MNKSTVSRASRGTTTPGLFGCVATELAAQGWQVFPLVPRSKTPYAGSHGHLDATDDPVRVSRWAREKPEANVGLRPPEGVVVLDVDAPREFRRWLAQRDLELPRTREVATRRGRHLYYLLPELQRSVRRELRGVKVDCKTSSGFVLAPGSVAPSGKRYRLLRELPLFALPTLGPEWVPHLQRPEPKRRAPVGGQGELPGTASGDPLRLARLLAVKRPGQGRRSFLLWALCEAWRDFGSDPPALERALAALEKAGLQVGLDADTVHGLSDWTAQQHDLKETTT